MEASKEEKAKRDEEKKNRRYDETAMINHRASHVFMEKSRLKKEEVEEQKKLEKKKRIEKAKREKNNSKAGMDVNESFLEESPGVKSKSKRKSTMNSSTSKKSS